jgi:2-polyprenyl-3-methyl-5-hydroxy-6-metoxy-1,4-benzoquinol methylase
MTGRITDPAIKYQAWIDLAERNNSHTLLHELSVASGRANLRMLEVGCSSGYLGASLVAKGHQVTGVEPDPASAEAAARVLTSVWNGGLDDYLDANPDVRFDVLIFGDVLEHMADSAAALRRALPHLAPEGSVVISLPNVAHGSVRAMLLEGRFDYADRGILDRTHLRFFTREGIAHLLAEAGLALDRLYQVGQPVESVGREYDMRLQRELITAVELLDDDDTRHAFQYVLLARPSTQSIDALLAANRAVPSQTTVPKPHVSGAGSWKQKLQVRLFRALLKRISARRFRGQ